MRPFAAFKNELAESGLQSMHLRVDNVDKLDVYVNVEQLVAM